MAKPSLSQMSGHVLGVTESPNHWWAISCASVSASGAPSNTGLVCVSSAYPAPALWSTIAPAFSNG